MEKKDNSMKQLKLSNRISNDVNKHLFLSPNFMMSKSIKNMEIESMEKSKNPENNNSKEKICYGPNRPLKNEKKRTRKSIANLLLNDSIGVIFSFP